MDLATLREAKRLEPPIALDELRERLSEERSRCADHHDVRLGHTQLRYDGTWMFTAGHDARLSSVALRQLCGRLELPGGGHVPASYIARCPNSLASQNLGFWIRSDRPDRRLLIRTTLPRGKSRPVVRAILSERYAVVDHLPVIESLAEHIHNRELRVHNWSLDDTELRLRLVVNEEHPASLDDPLRVGLQVTNSEIGLGRISIAAFVTRLVCSNGLVVRVADLGGVHRRHVGRASETLAWTFGEGLPHVLEQADEAARRFVRLRELPAPTPIEAFVRRTAERAELPEKAVERVQQHLEGETLYDVVNAFTRAAQHYQVAERVRIETLMSRFLQDAGSWN